MKKNRFAKKLPPAILFFCCWLLTGFQRPAPADKKITIRFKNWVGTQELKLFDETYTDPFGEPFVVSKFRYYISHFSYSNADNKKYILPGEYLVSEEDSLSKLIVLPAAENIQSISFQLGIDSIQNVSGVQTGSLDPMNGMFWTWNSGYVFAKLEGESDSSHAPVHSFSWHIGGFRQQENAIRKITLAVGNKLAAGGDQLVINANILAWFNGVHPVRISASPVCHQPGKLAMQIADNYSAMFSVSP